MMNFKCNVNFIILSLILGKVYNENCNFLSDISAEEFAHQIEFTGNTFQYFGEVQNEGLYFVTLLLTFNAPKLNHFHSTILQYISIALRDYKNEQLFQTGLESLNLVIISQKVETKPFIVEKIADFLALTQNTDVNSKLTLRLINTLQHIAFNYPDIFAANY